MNVLLPLVLTSTPLIEAYVSACAVFADGFAVPLGAASPAAGVVVKAKDGQVEVEHCFHENAQARTVRTVVEGFVKAEVKAGDLVARGQRLGTGGRAVSTIDGQPAAAFARGRERLVVPGREPVLVVVDVEAHRAVRFAAGLATHEWEVGRGQAEGAKEKRGDLRTPRGLYFVVEHSTGPFSGDFAQYFGGAWVKLNYPNAFDAERGVDAGLITRRQANDISGRWSKRSAVPQRTRLGGGIGFHGWSSPWNGDGGYGLSWGCVVLHPEEARVFYDLVPLGAAVVLL